MNESPIAYLVLKETEEPFHLKDVKEKRELLE